MKRKIITIACALMVWCLAGIFAMAEEPTATEPTDGAVTEQESVESTETASVKDGLVVENGDTYYYENGDMVRDTIVSIDGAYYYFQYYGAMMTDDTTYYFNADTGESGDIRADESGKLVTGWYQTRDYDGNLYWEYYGTDCFRYSDGIAAIGGHDYYFDTDGIMLQNDTVMVSVDDDWYIYKADGNGYLTIVQAPANNGWVQEGDAWYYYRDGKPIWDEFVRLGGKLYYLDYDGRMAVGFFETYRAIDSGNYTYDGYLADANGVIYEGTSQWILDQGDWYWLDAEGHLVYGEIATIGSKDYWFDFDGKLQIGRVEFSITDENGDWVDYGYLTDSNGAIIKKPLSWVKFNGEWYYLDENNNFLFAQERVIGGKYYYFNYDGSMATGYFEDADGDYHITDTSGAYITKGWAKDGMLWYYADAQGNLLREQWSTIGGKKYYFTYDGDMAVGTFYVDEDGYYYLFDASGAMVQKLGTTTGWSFADGYYYYCDGSGETFTGWVGDYYVHDGVMSTNQFVESKDGEHWSYVMRDGKMATGWCKYYGTWLWADANGNLLSDCWTKSGSKWYYFEDVYMLVDCVAEIKGKREIFDENGVWLGTQTTGGWKLIGGSWYYFNSDGSMNQKEKLKIGSKEYYFQDSGEMIENDYVWDNGKRGYIWINANGNRDLTDGWKKDRHNWYYLKDGFLLDGFQTIGGQEYYLWPEMVTGLYTYWDDEKQDYTDAFFGRSGARIYPTTGWYSAEQYGDILWYYFENGKPIKDSSRVIGGTQYYFQEGLMMTGPCEVGTVQKLFDKNGKLVTNRWYEIDGDWFYGDAYGNCLRGEHVIGGKKYWFDEWGFWLP